MNSKILKENISKLPSGGITKKRIKNKKTGEIYEYNVYQWRENGKQKSKYLKDHEVQKYIDLINERKKMEEKLFVMENEPQYLKSPAESPYLSGNQLREFINSAKNLKKREIINSLEEYIFGDETNRVFILYGLRRTGKTTMIKQVIGEMSENDFSKTAFIQVNSGSTLGNINLTLKDLFDNGFRYIFIDEVTMMDDFIEGASLFADIYASSGMKIVLSGTDSLGFWISKSNELYDRCRLLHTTFIPYREFETVLGIKGIDSYIEYGGTMSMSGEHYNAFASKETTDEYIDSSIARNIQHSLKCYQNEGHFRHLYSLYESGELTSAINRVVEDINHRFTIEVLTKDWKSNDLSLSARNLRKENNVLDLVNKDLAISRLKELLEIKNKSEQSVVIDNFHEIEIKNYLEALDLIKEIKMEDIDSYGVANERTAFTQPGLRYSQAKNLINALMRDQIFSKLSFDDRKFVTTRILNEIKGRMLEDIVLLETAIAMPSKEVFKLQFSDGEYDMVVFDNENGGCSIYEIKYTTEANDSQIRHLIDNEKSIRTEFRYGEIHGRYVLYRGENQVRNSVQYINVEDYLKSL